MTSSPVTNSHGWVLSTEGARVAAAIAFCRSTNGSLLRTMTASVRLAAAGHQSPSARADVGPPFPLLATKSLLSRDQGKRQRKQREPQMHGGECHEEPGSRPAAWCR